LTSLKHGEINISDQQSSAFVANIAVAWHLYIRKEDFHRLQAWETARNVQVRYCWIILHICKCWLQDLDLQLLVAITQNCLM